MMAGPEATLRWIGDEEPDEVRHEPDADREHAHRLEPPAPEARRGGRQHHQADGEQRAERLEAADQIEDDEHQEDEMDERPDAADAPEKHRVHAFGHERPPDERERDAASPWRCRRSDRAPGRSSASTVPNSTCIRSMLEPLQRDEQHAERQRDQVEGGEARILLLDRGARDGAGEQRHGEARDEAAERHRQELAAPTRGSRRPRRAGSHAPSRRRKGSCGAA